MARLLGAKLTAGRLRGPFVARDVYKAGWAGLMARDGVERALAFLVDLGWLRSVSTTSGTGGRPSIRYLINPAIAHQGGGE